MDSRGSSRVSLDPARLEARAIDPLMLERAIGGANVRQAAGGIVSDNRDAPLQAGSWLHSADDVRNVVVRMATGGPVRVGDVASVREGAAEPTRFVSFHPKAGEGVSGGDAVDREAEGDQRHRDRRYACGARSTACVASFCPTICTSP